MKDGEGERGGGPGEGEGEMRKEDREEVDGGKVSVAMW